MQETPYSLEGNHQSENNWYLSVFLGSWNHCRKFDHNFINKLMIKFAGSLKLCKIPNKNVGVCERLKDEVNLRCIKNQKIRLEAVLRIEIQKGVESYFL